MEEAWLYSLELNRRTPVETIARWDRTRWDRKEIARRAGATWRAHSTGRGDEGAVLRVALH